MKFIKILFLITISFSLAQAQNNGGYRLSVYTEVLDYGYNQINYYGVSGQYFINDNFSLNYNYALGVNSNSEMVVHIPGALALLGLTPIYEESLIFMFLVPEGVSYHNYTGHNLETEFYCNPLGMDYDILDNEKLSLTGSAGVKAYFKYENFSVSPYAGFRLVYGKGSIMPVFGVSLDAVVF